MPAINAAATTSAARTAADAASLLFHPLADYAAKPTPNDGLWTPELDAALALAVRKHAFDFARAAEDLRNSAVTATACRQRWAALDLAACLEHDIAG